MNHENYVIGTLSNDSFVMVNKKLSKRIGFTEAGLLAELIFTHKTVKQNNDFFEEGKHGQWFYLTQAKVEEQIGIKRREHENAVKNLVKNLVISKKLLGIPAKNHYLINWQKIVELFEEEEVKEEKKDPEPLIQSVCTKRTNKDGLNVQTGLDETSIHTSNKRTTIKTTNKNKDKELVNKGVNKNQKNHPENNLNKKQEYDPNIENITHTPKKEQKSDYDGTEPYGVFLVNVMNEFYTKFAHGRWNKKQWEFLIEKLGIEIVTNDEIEIYNHRGYIHNCLSNIAYRHDLKHGKIESRKPIEGLPLYDYWLDEIDEKK